MKSSKCQPKLNNNSKDKQQTINEWLSALKVGDKVDHYCDNEWVIGTVIEINDEHDANFVIKCDKRDSTEEPHYIKWNDYESDGSMVDDDPLSSAGDHIIDSNASYSHRFLSKLYSNTFHHNYIVNKHDKYYNFEEPCKTQARQQVDDPYDILTDGPTYIDNYDKCE